MIRLRTIAVMLAVAAAAPAAWAQTQSANSDTTFASHGDPQPKQNDPATTGAMRSNSTTHHRRMRKPSTSSSMSSSHMSGMSGAQSNNMTANTH